MRDYECREQNLGAAVLSILVWSVVIVVSLLKIFI